MKQFIKLTGEEINSLGNEGYRLADVKPATGVNTVVLTFKADGKDDLEYSAKVHATGMDAIAACVGKEPVEVFVVLWNTKKITATQSLCTGPKMHGLKRE